MTEAKEAEQLPKETRAGVLGWLHSWRYFIWLLALVLLTVLFYAEENWRGKRAWENYQRQMKARGEPSDTSSFIPKPVPMSENFAMTPFLAPLFEFRPGTQKLRSGNAMQAASGFAPAYDSAARMVKSPKKEGSNSWVTVKTDLALWHAAFLLGTNAPSAGKIIDADAVERFSVKESASSVLEALSEADPVIEEIRAASQRKYSRFDIKYDEDDPAGILLPHLAVLKHFCQVLQLRASAELALGRTAEAAKDVSLMLQLIDCIRDEPIMISQLVRMGELRLAIQSIAEGMGQWSEPQLAAFQERLGQVDFCADLKRAFDAERVFFGGGIIDYLRRNPGMYSALSGGAGNANAESFPAALLTAAPSGWFDFEKANYGRLFDSYAAATQDLTRHRINPQAGERAERQVRELVEQSWPMLLLHHRVFSSLLMPGFGGVLRKTAFAQTSADLAAVACAVERYRLAHNGFPDSLEALTEAGPVPLPLVLVDIINGQPLHYRRTPEGSYVLYSVGWNEKDDGGAIVRVNKPDGGQEFRSNDVPLAGDWVWRPL